MKPQTTIHVWRAMQVITWVAMIIVVIIVFNNVQADADRHARQDQLEQQQTCEFRRALVTTIERSSELELDPNQFANDPALQAYAIQKQINRQQYITDIQNNPALQDCSEG